MLQVIKSLTKLEVLLLVALLFLGGLFAKREITRPKEKAPVVQMVPAKIVYIEGKEHAQLPEVVVTAKQFKDATKDDKKTLKAHAIESETTIVDHIDTSNHLHMPYDTVKIIHYDIRKWFLAPLEHKEDITHSDTSVHTLEGKSITYEAPKVLFVVGPYLGCDFFTKKPSFGVSITFNVFAIKSKK